MRNTPTALLAIASVLAVSSSAMAQPIAQRSHRLASQTAEIRHMTRAPAVRYDPSVYAFEPTYGPGQLLFERAKGNID